MYCDLPFETHYKPITCSYQAFSVHPKRAVSQSRYLISSIRAHGRQGLRDVIPLKIITHGKLSSSRDVVFTFYNYVSICSTRAD